MMVGEQANDNRWSTTMSNSSASDSSAWSRYEDKVFERALVAFPEEMADRWEKIAERIPGKSAGEVREHYEALVQDVIEIDSGRVELPSYPDESESALGWEAAESSQISFGPAAGRNKGGEVERKKGTPWTEEEHRRFWNIKVDPGRAYKRANCPVHDPFSWTGTPVRRGADSMNLYAHRGFLVGPASGRWVGLVSGLIELCIS